MSERTQPHADVAYHVVPAENGASPLRSPSPRRIRRQSAHLRQRPTLTHGSPSIGAGCRPDTSQSCGFAVNEKPTNTAAEDCRKR